MTTISIANLRSRTFTKRLLHAAFATPLVAAALLSGCATPTRSGAVGGGAAGAGLGAIIGHQSGHTGEGAVIGGAVGAASGALVGNSVGRERRRNEDRGHYEYRTVTKPNGDTYHEKFWVQD